MLPLTVVLQLRTCNFTAPLCLQFSCKGGWTKQTRKQLKARTPEQGKAMATALPSKSCRQCCCCTYRFAAEITCIRLPNTGFKNTECAGMRDC